MGLQTSKPKPKPKPQPKPQSKPQPKPQPNPKSSIPDLSNDIDSLCALGVENDDDPEVELTEEDLNDPNLLVRFLISYFLDIINHLNENSIILTQLIIIE